MLLVEDVDLAGGTCLAREVDLPLARRVIAAITTLMAAAGTDTAWARFLPEKLQRVGLADVGAQIITRYLRGGDERGDVIRMTVERLRPQIESQGLLRGAEIEDFLHRTMDPEFHLAALPMVSAWGRKPV